MSNLRSIPIHRVANRYNLFMGGDRELVMTVGLVAFALIFSAQTFKASLVGMIIWSLSLYLLRKMAKSDPLMRFVYLRHRKYKRYYTARSTPFNKSSKRYS